MNFNIFEAEQHVLLKSGLLGLAEVLAELKCEVTPGKRKYGLRQAVGVPR